MNIPSLCQCTPPISICKQLPPSMRDETDQVILPDTQKRKYPSRLQRWYLRSKSTGIIQWPWTLGEGGKSPDWSLPANAFRSVRSNEASTPKILGRRRAPQYIFAVRIEPHVPESNALHQTLRFFQFPIPAKNGIHKFAAAVFAHLHRAFATILLGSFPHKFFTSFQKLLEPAPQPIATLQEIFHHLTIIVCSDARKTFIRSFHFPREFDQQEPQVAGYIGHRGGRAMMEDSPVVNPFTERVGIKHTAQQKDRWLSRIPVLDGVTGGDPSLGGIRGRRHRGWRCRLGRFGGWRRPGLGGMWRTTRPWPLGLWVRGVIVGMHLVVGKIRISFGVLLLGMASTRLDVGVQRRIICFVRRINDDALCRRLHGRVSLVAISIATAPVAGRGKAASFLLETVDITHIWLPILGHRFMPVQTGIEGRRWVSRGRMPSGGSTWRRIALLSWVSLARVARRWRRCGRLLVRYIIIVALIRGGGAGGRSRRGGVVVEPNISWRRNGIMIHVEESFALIKADRLYTHVRRFVTWIGTEDINSEVGRHPLPGGVVVAEEEKGRTLALSLTHRVGRIDTWTVEKTTMKDPEKILRVNHVVNGWTLGATICTAIRSRFFLRCW